MSQLRTESGQLMQRAAAGDAAAWGALLIEHEPRLGRIIAFRLDPRLKGRIDAGDVLQQAYLEAAAHRADYFGQVSATAQLSASTTTTTTAAAAPVPLFLWLRGIVSNKLLELHRHHLGTRMRDAKRESPLDAPAQPDETSAALCAHLTAGITRPSVAAARGEVRERLSAALAEMDPTDREVLALRHFEQLSNAEAAEVLGIQERAAAKRYLRALQRLKAILAAMPGGLTELRP